LYILWWAVAGNHHSLAMLAEIYIEALLIDEEAADAVWKAWDAGEIDEAAAFIAWWLVANSRFEPSHDTQKALS